MSKSERAIRLRDLARVVLRARGGRWQQTNIGRFISLDTDALRVLYRTPFQKLPEISHELKYWAEASGDKIDLLPYGLDIWATGRGKVLNITWSAGGAVE